MGGPEEVDCIQFEGEMIRKATETKLKKKTEQRNSDLDFFNELQSCNKKVDISKNYPKKLFHVSFTL